jgi:ATP-binding cassette subfamily B protein
MNNGRLSTLRLAGRLVTYRPGIVLLSLVLFVVPSSSLLLIGWLLKQIFNAMNGSGPAGLDSYGIIAVLAAVELARIAASWGGVVRSFYFEQLRGLLRLNLIRAQMASGGGQAGSLPAATGDAVSRFRDDVTDFLVFVEISIFVAGERDRPADHDCCRAAAGHRRVHHQDGEQTDPEPPCRLSARIGGRDSFAR